MFPFHVSTLLGRLSFLSNYCVFGQAIMRLVSFDVLNPSN